MWQVLIKHSNFYYITIHDNHQLVIKSPIDESFTQSQVTTSSGAKCNIQEFYQPSDWVSNLVVEKKNGSQQLCLDPKDLNKAIKCKHYRIPTMEEIAAKFAGRTVFFSFDLKDATGRFHLMNKVYYCVSLAPHLFDTTSPKFWQNSLYWHQVFQWGLSEKKWGSIFRNPGQWREISLHHSCTDGTYKARSH